MKRNTIQRALILKAVKKLQCHPTADEVYAAVVAEHPTISRGTVFRNLKQLSKHGEIRNLEIPAGADRFDHCCHEHHHVRCLECGGVFDVDMEFIPDLECKIRDAHGFEFSGYDLTFKGICPECARSSQTGAHQRTKLSGHNNARRHDHEKHHDA